MARTRVDYYKILEIDPSATEQQIRTAYKRAALKSHPDRVPANSPERASRTKKFQQVNDAYYTLSNATRRREYDEARKASATSEQWANFAEQQQQQQAADEPSAAEQFGSIFEEMLREEGLAEDDTVHGGTRPTGRFWSVVGGISGAALGFIVANFPGAVAGAVAGNRLGAVRDSKGKSVYAVFQELPQQDKARLLSELAARVLRSAVS
ncbi:hypothetical protein AJ80_05778 [Polytolypa hystricis UAMH7299]|uniref:J domain-containing protein n=1 Tax=Polytolypa hystricis (strain UAMH7299) TaxID=1447883 RepID=A0A2B7Y1X1_POLH7|nr:hypothetical protein AJ80_05778 [Polytolypa hystricis UAMH7299]